MSSKKQTVIDILISQLKEEIIKSAHHDAATIRTGDYRIGLGKAIELCEEAKEIHKEEIEEAFANGVDDEYEWHINNQPRTNTEQYYKETYE